MTDIKKYRCNNCGEIFEILKSTNTREIFCPRCYSGDSRDFNACLLAVGPPPWEYHCLQCNSLFLIASPKGPDEARAFRCPVCRSSRLKWQTSCSSACASGG